jgi:hypothetical protein
VINEDPTRGVLVGDAVPAERPALQRVQRVFAVLCVSAEPEVNERVEQLVSRVLCGADEAMACRAS